MKKWVLKFKECKWRKEYNPMNNKFVKVLFNTKSGASDFHYKINIENIALNWNPKETEPDKMGGFNFSNEENILRWLIRGDTLYDVIIPEGAEVIKINNKSTPNGVYRTNKIILKNPRPITDELAKELYQKSQMPPKTCYKALAGLAIRGYINTCKLLIKERINKDNIEEALKEINDFVKPENTKYDGNIAVYKEVRNILENIRK